MINNVIQLVAPKTFAYKFAEVPLCKRGYVLVRPDYMAICHADQRYYQGLREPEVLRRKLPMALIHEACGHIVSDPSGTFSPGQKVVLIPNVPGTPSNHIYENYSAGSRFRSSGIDGFLQEHILLPLDRVVAYSDVPDQVAAISEFVSVCMHALNRMETAAHTQKNSFAVFGDGSLAYTMGLALRASYPDSTITVLGHHTDKLELFTFADNCLHSDNIPSKFTFDHAFECTGGTGCQSAIDSIIQHSRPQGTVMLMGVSEQHVPIYTRNVLEKGMTFVGCSRSGRSDFEAAVRFLSSRDISNRLKRIIFESGPVCSIEDLKQTFVTDLNTPFKTVFKWNL